MTNITLYSFIGDKKQLDKLQNITQIAIVSGEFRADVDLLNPVFDIELPLGVTTSDILKTCNYCYIADFGRFYYIDKMICKAGTIIEIQASIDVLNSWAYEILQLSEGIVERNAEADGSNIYLDDSEIHVYNNPNIQTYTFEYAEDNMFEFGKQNFVLAVAGS